MFVQKVSFKLLLAIFIIITMFGLVRVIIKVSAIFIVHLL